MKGLGLLRTLVGGLAAYELLKLMKAGSKQALRPPGASDEDEFLALCTRCGKCNQACPYKSILMGSTDMGLGLGTPFIDARESPCWLCEDFPCVEACPTTALSGIHNRYDVEMGTAVINEDICIAYHGMRCEVCYRECPLIDEAITINYFLRPGFEKHAVFAPVIDKEKCVGCGICVHKCPVDTPEIAIQVKPRKAGGLL